MNQDLALRRLRNQHLARPRAVKPEEVVAWFGAMQGQEYPHAKWGLAQRMRRGNRDAVLEQAFDEGRILRTHVLRPTWHFVTREDIGWMLALTGPRVQRTARSYNRRNGLDARFLTRALSVFERTLGTDSSLTRAELGAALARNGLRATTMQLWLLTLHAELEGMLASGPRRGRHATYALLSERAKTPRRLAGDEAIAELVRRFFQSHGPATIRDFVWWSGLTTTDARRGLDIIGARREGVDGLTYWSVGREPARGRGSDVYLLPIYDEYVVAYRDRAAVPHGPANVGSATTPSVTFQHALIVGGAIAGTWRVVRRPGGIELHVSPRRPLRRAERSALADAGERYARFLGTRVSIASM